MDLSSLFKKTIDTQKAKSLNTVYVTGPVVTRIAPSPTGHLHIGTARSALFNFLFARNKKGTFIVRIEDTDTKRSKKEYEKDILGSLEWLGIKYDALYRQSERTEIYTSYIDTLLKSGQAYLSKEESKQNPNEVIEIVRLKNPNRKIVFNDMVRGEIIFDTTELGDFVIARSITEPLYHLAVVIDDYEMKVTHIIRGEDHISNTPRQILIQEALNIPRPHYAHIPLILASDRSKMSKRGGESAHIKDLKEKGYLPTAVINYLALLGWNPGTSQELFSLEDLIKTFDIKQIGRGGAIFSTEKLKWFNKQYLKDIPEYQFKKLIHTSFPERLTTLPTYNEKIRDRLTVVLREKVKSLEELKGLAESGELDYYFIKPEYETTKLLWKYQKEGEISKEETKKHLETIITLLGQIPSASFSPDAVKKAIWEYAEEKGRGAVLWPLRFALSGKDKSPDPFSISYTIGKKETLERITTAIQKLQKTSV